MNNSTSTIWQYQSARNDVNTAIFVFGTILFIIGFVGNFVTVTFIVRSKTLHTPTYVTICCLAVSDGLASVCRYILLLPDSAISWDKPYEWALSLFLTFNFLFLHSAYFHMTFVSYVRYVFLAKPLKSLEIDNKSILKLSGTIWICSLIIGVGYGISFVFDLNDGLWTEFGFRLYLFLVPFVLVVYFHIKKMYYLYNLPSLSPGNNQMTSRLSRIFSIIISIYLASNVYPFINTFIWLVFGLKSEVYMYFSVFYSNIFHLFLLFNNCINPLIYFMASPPCLRLLTRAQKHVCTCMWWPSWFRGFNFTYYVFCILLHKIYANYKRPLIL